ncbi:MAG TPA: alpha/beta hydrolase fold domain-containing protein [Thermoanaerobaculia bacterium]|nr:alpha/beta hydrolase fold domain-containing protein [Thermoanaerobaculia bacterium]
MSLFLLGALAPFSAQAQTCQTFSGLTYASWTAADGSTRNLQLDLLVPSGASAPVPVVVWIHGGGWFQGSRTPIPSGVSALCSRGFAVASIDYRLTADAVWPAQIQDCKGAVRWLRAHAGQYGLDPDRFAAWGESAGGQLANMLGVSGGLGTVSVGSVSVDLEGTMGGNAGQSSRVQAVVDWFGHSDLLRLRFYPATTLHDPPGSPESKLIGGPIQKNPERAATASPVSFVSPDDPPFLILHGTIDDLVAFNQSEILADALRSRGVPVSFVPVPNVGHGGPSFSSTTNLQTVYQFLDDRLGNLGSATVSVSAGSAFAETSTGSSTFTITRTGSLAAPLTVRWGLAGTAEAGPDFNGPTKPVTIPAGSASAMFSIRPENDRLAEGNETVVLTLAPDPAYRIDAAQASASLTIADDDSAASLPEVTLQAVDPAAAEAGPDSGNFLLSLASPLGADLTVRYQVSGTAANGVDYAPLSGSMTLPAGETSVLVPVNPVDDNLGETGETVILALAQSPAYRIGSPAQASVVIADSELDPLRPATPIISVSATDPTAGEPANDGAFTVTRTGATDTPLTAELSFGGSARTDVDYGVSSLFVTFDSGVSRVVVPIDLLDDFKLEGPETVALGVVPPSDALAGPYLPLVTITDDELTTGLDGLYTLTPCRLVDTRRPAGPGGAPRIDAGSIRVFPASDACGIPPEATAVAINVTVVGPTAPGYFTLFEAGGARPISSTLNFRAGELRSNNAIIPLAGFPRALAVYGGFGNGSADVVIDVTGYFR